MRTISIYKFSLVGKWHQNPTCTGMRVIGSKLVPIGTLVVMDTNGEICHKCKSPARTS